MADDENDFEDVTQRPTKKRKSSKPSKAEPAPKKIKLTKKDSDLRTQDSKVKEKDPQDSKKPVQQKIAKAYKKKSPNKNNDKPKTKIIIEDDDDAKQSDNEAAKEVKVKQRKKKSKVEEELSDKATPTPPSARKNNLLKATPRKSSRSPSRGSASSEVSFEEHEDEAAVEWNFNAQEGGEVDKDSNKLSSFFDVDDDEPTEPQRPVFLQLADQNKPKKETKKRQKRNKSSKTAIISELTSDLTQLNEGAESSGSKKDEPVSDLTDISPYEDIELTEEDLAKITEQEILSQSQSIQPSVPSPPKALALLNVQPVPIKRPSMELPLRDLPPPVTINNSAPSASQPVSSKPTGPFNLSVQAVPPMPRVEPTDAIKPLALSQRPMPKSPTRLTASRTPQSARNNIQNRGFNQLPLSSVPVGNNTNTNNTNSNSSTDSADLATQSSLIKSSRSNNNSLLASNQPSRNQSLDNSVNLGSLQSPVSSQSSQVIKDRYLKLRILYICPPGKTQYYKEKKFYAQNDKGDEYNIVLKDDWEDTPLKPGDYINVVGKPEPNNPMAYVINKTRNCLILHPDQLITGTLISESIKCQRLPVLDIKTKSSGESKHTIVGKIMHEVFQKALDNNDFSDASLKQHIEILILLFLENLYSVDCQESEAKKTLEGYIPAIVEWANKYCAKVNANHSNNNGKNSRGGSFSAGSRQKKYKVQICKVLEIEENILSLMYGLKGYIDLSVEALIQNEKGYEERCTVPLELKTGNKQVQHEAQVVLYGLLMSDRYNADIKGGLLYSMKEREMNTINITRDTVVGLLRKRNELVSYIVSNKLPPMLRLENTCKRCFSADKCTIYGKLEGITEEMSGMGSFYTEKTKHLKSSHLAFLARYERLLYLEEQELVKLNKQIWQMDISSREKNGRCLSGMFLEEEAKVDEYWTYRFRREHETDTINIFDLQINEGDHVFLTMDGQEIGSDKGTVIELTPKSIVVELRVPVKTPANVEQFASSQRFGGLMLDIDDIGQNTRKSSKKLASLVVKHTDREILKDLRWRIDKEEMVSSQTARTNLMKLFTTDGSAQRKRELIVDLDPPQFENEMTDASINNIMSQHSGSKGPKRGGIGLNIDQSKAARKALAARDYLLISGKPGTGKTTAIVVLIHMLITSGKTVLVTAYTHSAVDNICLKLKERGIDFLRVGGKHQVHPDIHSYIPNYEKNVKTFADIEQSYGNKSIVALTCMSASSAPLIRKRTFDYCILDEASQLTLPISLGPIFFANTFVLVGDPYQLPPLVKSPEAKQEGLDVSLFFYLSQTHPEAVVELDHQYRMNADIMTLSNRLIYDGKLRVGSAEVAQGCLQIPRLNLPQLVSPLAQDWLREVLLPQRKVIFLNTDNVPAPEVQHEDNIVRNDVEAALVALLADTMVWCGIKQQKIGVISPWRSQLKVIHHQLNQVNISNIEVHTVDKYQGRDKDCIIVSLVRSNAQQNVGNLLREWRRLNVALTRAKTKLILIGSRSTFFGQTLFTSLLELVDERQWQVDLPLNAHQLYVPRKRQSGSASTQM